MLAVAVHHGLVGYPLFKGQAPLLAVQSSQESQVQALHTVFGPFPSLLYWYLYWLNRPAAQATQAPPLL